MNENEIFAEKGLKIRLSAYAALSALCFLWLVMPRGSALGVPVFAAVQLAALWLLGERRRLWYIVPIMLISLNSFISGSELWRRWNFVIVALLFAAIYSGISLRRKGCGFLFNIIERAFSSLRFASLPARWAVGGSRGRGPLIKRVLKGVAIAAPCVIVLIFVLSSADMVFAEGTSNMFSNLLSRLRIGLIGKAIVSVVIGLYLFGLVCSFKSGYPLTEHRKEQKIGDLLVMNIFFCSVLAVYTVFVAVQFRYLFAGAQLPYGLSYTDYARRGFFELLALSAVNIALILFATDRLDGRRAGFTKGLCAYLCGVTLVMLVSSFYRMTLYCGSDGLTRLRFFVLGFLIFEALGLFATFVYIFKPRFNVIVVYMLLGLCYYVLLNLVPVDRYVARSQVDMYLAGQRHEVGYALTLSSDAAEEIARLVDDENFSIAVEDYFTRCTETTGRWQSYNLSRAKAEKIWEEINKAS